MAHALIFGASGVSGWAVTNAALDYPSKDAFAQVTALTNRPLSIEEASLPNDPRLNLVSGIDLTGTPQSVAEGLRSKVKNVDSISHVFFMAYIEKPDYDSLRIVNTDIFQTALTAIEQVAPSLKAVILQTGGKGYGLEWPDKIPIKTPLHESYPRIPKPYYDNIFYYTQHDAVLAATNGKSWTFSEIRPDVIVGFTPGANFMNVAQGIGFYLTLWREVYGKDTKVPWPGNSKSWVNTHTDTFQDILGKQEIWFALNQDKTSNGASFNAANGDITTWEKKWPALCAYFGLVGEGPGPEPVDYAAFAAEHKDVWHKLEEKHGLKTGLFDRFSWGFLKAITIGFDFDREYDLTAARSAGFNETISTPEGYTISFDRMQAAKIIP
ncbi:hypothetical protein FH972_023457 [Carpinus fangiana]|uniref:PRISE-like Rossmann-fold domain-containing protein n=1 Tax=Carpinus fangiana TaxID=176857 RepID=A0A5N6KXI7_9ROSI|nr:hypothetical protein FH972_023457 [Carpinus fangiana]